MCAAYDRKAKQWGHLDDKPLDDPDVSMGQVLLDKLSKWGNKVAQINDDTGAQMTFDVVWLRTIRAAQNLLKRGFEPRQRFGFMAGNDDNLLPMFLASVCLACSIVPFDPMLTKEEIARDLARTKSAVVFCHSNSYNTMNEAIKDSKWDVKIFTFGDHVNGVEPVENLFVETGEENDFVPVHIDIENDIAGIFGSSETTGPSKCVCMKYGHSVFHESSTYDDNCIMHAFDSMSIYWAVGIKLIIDCVHNGATRIITNRPYSPKFQLQLIERYRSTHVFTVPYHLIGCLMNELIHETDLSCVKQLTFYGGRMPPSLAPELSLFFPNAKLVSWYELTEMGTVSIGRLDVVGDNCGERLVDGCIAKIVDVDGNRCGPNVNGEVVIRKKYKFGGYLDDAVATAATMDDDGWFKTGDIGHFDERGLLYIEDRKKNSIFVIYFEAVVLPSELEEYLISVPDIEEVCIVGIPTTVGASLPAAVIVRDPDSKLSEHEVYNLIAALFPERSRLRGGVHFVDSMPKTCNGKFIRKQITEMATEMFRSKKDSDPNIKSYLMEFPEEVRALI